MVIAIPARMPMISTTTSSSRRVKPDSLLRRLYRIRPPCRRRAVKAEGRQGDGGKDADDEHDDEEFDEREALLLGADALGELPQHSDSSLNFCSLHRYVFSVLRSES